MSTSIVSYGYAALLIAGGFMAAAKSPVSLYTAGGSGFLVLVLEYLAGRNSVAALYLQVFLAAALTSVGLWRYSVSSKFMPGGMVAALSFIMAVLYTLRVYGAGAKPKGA